MERDNVRVTIRVDKSLKEAADELFSRLGLNMTTALSVFLRKAVDENCIPFTIGTKTAVYDSEYLSSDELSVSEVTRAFKGAVQNAKDNAKGKGCPIARYDAESKRAYLEYPDGGLEYVN